MKGYALGDVSPSQYESLTPEEFAAWMSPQQSSYHSFHVERMGVDTYRFRDSKSARFYICTHKELCEALITMLSCRKYEPTEATFTSPINLLSQQEVDDLLSDL